jgi:hypothetical protein
MPRDGPALEQAPLAGDNGCLGAIRDVEFRQDATYVRAHRGGADAQVPSNLHVGLALGDKRSTSNSRSVSCSRLGAAGGGWTTCMARS